MEPATLKAHQAPGTAASRPPFRVRDLALAEWGRKEIRLAEHEMPGLMTLRERYEQYNPRPCC
jgi:adenosylhomocysteinase